VGTLAGPEFFRYESPPFGVNFVPHSFRQLGSQVRESQLVSLLESQIEPPTLFDES